MANFESDRGLILTLLRPLLACGSSIVAVSAAGTVWFLLLLLSMVYSPSVVYCFCFFPLSALV